MIVNVKETPKSYYGKYFYVGESSTNHNEEEVVMEARTRRRRVRVSDDEPSEEREPITPAEPEDNEPISPAEPEDSEPITPAEPDGTEPVSPAEPEDSEPVSPAEPEDNEPISPAEPEDSEPVSPAEPDDDNAEISTDDPNGEDNGDNGGTDDGSNNNEDPGPPPDENSADMNDNQSGDNQQQKGPGLEYDSTRKYVLFQNFISLNDAITNYISKLEKIIGDSVEENKLIKESIDKLTKIQTLCCDYMLMKFELSSYVQSQLFYQNLIIMVQMVFDVYSKAYSKIRK